MKEHFVHLTFHNEASSSNAKPRKKDKRKNKGAMKVNKGQSHKELKFYFCKKVDHFKKDCSKRKIWFEKKGMYYICFRMF